MLDLIRKIAPMRRDLVSDGYDEALDVLFNEYQMRGVESERLEWTSGTPVLDWTIPPKWSVREAWFSLDRLPLNGLGVMSYSEAIDRVVEWDEFRAMVHTRRDMPDAVPYEFSFYKRKTGICLPFNLPKMVVPLQPMPVKIDARFEQGKLQVGNWRLDGDEVDTILLCAHLDHPYQANDGLSGVIVGLEVMRELAKRKRRFTYEMIVVPETIGSIAYLDQWMKALDGDPFTLYRYGIFLEMLGNRNTLALQRTLADNMPIDRVAARHTVRQYPFRQLIVNDEMVWNNPTVGVPMISLSRYPYPEYHTSADNANLMDAAMLDEAKAKVLAIIEDLEEGDRVPSPTWHGVPFLTKHDLWTDWRVNAKLNEAQDLILSYCDGERTVFEIAERCALPVRDVSDWLMKLSDKGLVKWE